MAVGVITILGYIIAFGGIYIFYIFVGSYIAQNVFGNPHIRGLTQIITIACGTLVVAPVVLGLSPPPPANPRGSSPSAHQPIRPR